MQQFRRTRDKRKYMIKIGAIALLCVALFVGAYCVLSRLEFREPAEAPYEDEVDYAEDNEYRVRYQGKWYKQNPDIKTTLVIGVDKEKFTEESKQSDFLMLLAVDYKNKTYRALHINRDTMVEVQQLDFMDNVFDTKEQQLALAYAHGQSEKVNCRNTVQAVEKLLYGITIDHYISVSMDAVPIVNDKLGGVSVYVEDDFSAIDPEIKQGETVTLRGKQALTFVRSRKSMEDPTNLARMERQRVYIAALRDQFNQQDGDSVLELLLEISNYFVSDCTAPQLAELVGLVAEADASAGAAGAENSVGTVGQSTPIETIVGTASYDGQYAEFRVDEAALTKQVMDMFFVESVQ